MVAGSPPAVSVISVVRPSLPSFAVRVVTVIVLLPLLPESGATASQSPCTLAVHEVVEENVTDFSSPPSS